MSCGLVACVHNGLNVVIWRRMSDGRSTFLSSLVFSFRIAYFRRQIIPTHALHISRYSQNSTNMKIKMQIIVYIGVHMCVFRVSW